MKLKKLVVITCVAFMCSSCMFFRTCHCEKKDFEKSLSFTEYTPLNISEFQSLILSDTTHHKVIMFYNPCCGGSHFRLSSYYGKLVKAADPSKTKVYFIADDCGGLKYAKDELNRYDFYPDKYYYLREPSVIKGISDDWLKEVPIYIQLMHATFPNAKLVDFGIYISSTFFVSPDNKIKLARFIHTQAGLETLTNLQSDELLNYDITQLDYNKIDTFYVSGEDSLIWVQPNIKISVEEAP